MKEKPWKITYKDEPWSSCVQGDLLEGVGYYGISFEGSHYGFISKDAWNDKNTGDILAFVEHMLNDAHQLALKEHD